MQWFSYSCRRCLRTHCILLWCSACRIYWNVCLLCIVWRDHSAQRSCPWLAVHQLHLFHSSALFSAPNILLYCIISITALYTLILKILLLHCISCKTLLHVPGLSWSLSFFTCIPTCVREAGEVSRKHGWLRSKLTTLTFSTLPSSLQSPRLFQFFLKYILLCYYCVLLQFHFIIVCHYHCHFHSLKLSWPSSWHLALAVASSPPWSQLRLLALIVHILSSLFCLRTYN